MIDPRSGSAPITAVVLTKNEELAIERCVRSLDFCAQVLVIDSNSSDRTAEIARDCGAEVLEFSWNGRYPKKKQWGMAHEAVKHDWVLHIDADEVVPSELAREIDGALDGTGRIVAYDIPIAYHFMGRRLQYGHRVWKRSLVRRDRAHFPEVGDLDAPGITEVEGHYQPVVDGAVARLRNRLIHDDPDPLKQWVARHNRYSDWEAFLYLHPSVRARVRERRSRGGKIFDRLPLKAPAFFIYAYVIRRGFLDGEAGLSYAISLTWYYWLTRQKVRELRRAERDYISPTQRQERDRAKRVRS